jgi:hypothetical protein
MNQLTQQQIKALWLANLYMNYPPEIFKFTFDNPVKSYIPQVTSQIIKTDGTEIAALCEYLTIYNMVEQKTYIIPMVHKINLSTVILLIDSMLNEEGLN